MTHPRNLDLSIIVTAHNEGLIAHKTLLSIEDALKLLPRALTYEIVISVDNGDDTTLAYARQYAAQHESTRVLEASFKDLSASRNNAVQHARGAYIAFIDADDLMSENWLATAYELAQTRPGTIIHPEYSITFGDDNLIWRKRDSENKTFDTLCLIDNNLWDSPCFAPRSIFEQTPYEPNGNGFGYEDKLFNTQTLAKDIPHLVAPQTLIFVRRKIEGSMLRGASSNMATIAPTPLFSFDAICDLDITPYADELSHDARAPIIARLKRRALSTAKHAARRAHSVAMRSDVYRQTIVPLRELRQAKTTTQLEQTFPQWMADLWRKIHVIDNTVFPARALLLSLPWYNAENITPGVHYAQLVQSVKKQPDTLFFVPHLIKGGADMLFINYTNALAEQHSDWRIAMLQTENKESVWKDKISDKIAFTDMYHTFQGLDNETQMRLMATFITQNNIKRILIGNSQFAYDFVSRHKTLMKRLGINIYCFAFGEEFDDEGRLWGHIHTGIPRVYDVLTRIITDNQNTVNKLVAEYAFSAEKFSVHYQPTSAKLLDRPVRDDTPPLRVLWASRIAKQKRPDILMAVANKLPRDKYIVDAYGQLEEDFTEDSFKNTAVNYKGVFNGIASLPTQDYDIFLYTSEGDGVPNVLQEMTASGLPIVASNVGGIREFIKTNDTGMLIEDHNNIDDYVSAIEKLRDSELRSRIVRNARKLLETQFSQEVRDEKIRKDIQ
jgi:glycosyltransferase involved in cell wall biosynthesis